MSADATRLRGALERLAYRASQDAAQETCTAIRAEQWIVGHPRDPFDPHQQLAMTTFEDRDDPQLANRLDWPPGEHFHPGDHDGCQCDIAPLPLHVRGTSQRPAGAVATIQAVVTPSTPAVSSRRGRVVAYTPPGPSGTPDWWPRALKREWPKALRAAIRRASFR